MNNAEVSLGAQDLYYEEIFPQPLPIQLPEDLQVVAISTQKPADQAQDNCGNLPEAQSRSVLSTNQPLPRKPIFPLEFESVVQEEEDSEEQKEEQIFSLENEQKPEDEKGTEEAKGNPVVEPNIYLKRTKRKLRSVLRRKIRFPKSNWAGLSQKQKKEKIDKKMKNIEAFRFRNVYKFILRNLNTYTNQNVENIKKILRDFKFSENEIEKNLEYIKSLKPAGSPGEPNKYSRYKVNNLMNNSVSLIFIFAICISSILKKLGDGEFQLIHKKNLETYREGCIHYLEKAKIRLNKKPELLAHIT
eukprot:TRINITY_DN634_c0_g1_i13.p1 TRINITY_DN634_c0_g1~~TRINITY_DN634_c0_g1_i13.p1  ORF type:complete len:302 (-),score=34.84 TRINITY_DN634_c0_g1_i13:249-1154(-)